MRREYFYITSSRTKRVFGFFFWPHGVYHSLTKRIIYFFGA